MDINQCILLLGKIFQNICPHEIGIFKTFNLIIKKRKDCELIHSLLLLK